MPVQMSASNSATAGFFCCLNAAEHPPALTYDPWEPAPHDQADRAGMGLRLHPALAQLCRYALLGRRCAHALSHAAYEDCPGAPYGYSDRRGGFWFRHGLVARPQALAYDSLVSDGHHAHLPFYPQSRCLPI